MAAAVNAPLIVITGPTASGKTALAIGLAERYGGEIVCADSRTVYKGLDIGTAKPTVAERQRVPHHLLDQIDPDEQYNLARFQADAGKAIAGIRARGKIPFLVGGSGLYIDSVVLDYELGRAADDRLRAELERYDVDELLRYCTENNIKIPDNYHNKRYVIRAIEQGGVNTNRRTRPDSRTIVFALDLPDVILKIRIAERARTMFDTGLLEEAASVAGVYGWAPPPLHAPAYAAARRYLHDEILREQAVEALARADWQLARKQRTWLRRHEWIHWLTPGDASQTIGALLAPADRSAPA